MTFQDTYMKSTVFLLLIVLTLLSSCSSTSSVKQSVNTEQNKIQLSSTTNLSTKSSFR